VPEGKEKELCPFKFQTVRIPFSNERAKEPFSDNCQPAWLSSAKGTEAILLALVIDQHSNEGFATPFSSKPMLSRCVPVRFQATFSTGPAAVSVNEFVE
jgi:hypothetical protein